MHANSKSSNADHQVIILAAGRSLRLESLTRTRPKCLLTVENQPILGHTLNNLSERGFRRLTLVVGYMREKIIETFGDRFEGIDIEYVINENYAETERGFSLYCTKSSWIKKRNPVVFMDADNFFEPAMLDRLMECAFRDVVLVDEDLDTTSRDEELVRGRDGVVSGLYRGRGSDYPDCVGGFVGMNRFSSEFMSMLFNHMDQRFSDDICTRTYEHVFDSLIRERGWQLNYLQTKGLPWINVNQESDYAIAKEIARRMKNEK